MSHQTGQTPKAVAGLTLAAVGVVYGDIGTSPLYTLNEAFGHHSGIAPTPANVLGILSLVCWSLFIVVSFKYVYFILRADNKGEGGILALMSLALRNTKRRRGQFSIFILLGIFGAALFYGDGMITPAISVLSAVEGLRLVDPEFSHYVLPITLAIIVGLFAVQARGTASVGKVFGPIMLVWFVALAILGVGGIMRHPGVLAALSPFYAVQFVLLHPMMAFLALGTVVLAITGGEAIYADMGHFGRFPIRLGWFGFVLPALLLNYMGQGALVLDDPAMAGQSFFMLAPKWLLLPMVLLSTAATVIASQAVISGAFSLTRQAIQLGYVPRMDIDHTSDQEIGQIYINGVNWSLFFIVILLVLGFQSSSKLAAAYGFAMCGMMVMTTLTAFAALKTEDKRKRLALRLLLSGLLLVDLAFLASNALKIPQGGWFPLAVGVVAVAIMFTWKNGRRLLFHRIHDGELPLDLFVDSIEANPPLRVEGTAIFMTGSEDSTPHALLHNLKHNRVLHEQVVFLTIQTADVPYVAKEDRLKVRRLSNSFWQVVARFGFSEEPSVPHILEALAEQHDLEYDDMTTSFFLSRETIIRSKTPALNWLQHHIFTWMQRNASRPTDFFKIPPNRVVEMGTQVEL
ncbi:potassium transporter Kup [Chitinimonas sp.]|uniref:potassium transporter Kup n=1 Tax=Chitinimonas sp. TaxID=1934313 RepID=UPI0035B1DF54